MRDEDVVFILLAINLVGMRLPSILFDLFLSSAARVFFNEVEDGLECLVQSSPTLFVPPIVCMYARN